MINRPGMFNKNNPLNKLFTQKIGDVGNKRVIIPVCASHARKILQVQKIICIFCNRIPALCMKNKVISRISGEKF